MKPVKRLALLFLLLILTACGGREGGDEVVVFAAASLEALDRLAERDLIFEINTGAMSRGYRTAPYPSPALLRAMYQRKVPICITSDCHDRANLLYAFAQAAELARSCGYQEQMVLTSRGFVPQALNTSIYDEIITVEDEDAFALGRNMGKLEGVLVGISSGAALWAAVQLAKRAENKGKTIVALLPDAGDRYLSTAMFVD